MNACSPRAAPASCSIPPRCRAMAPRGTLGADARRFVDWLGAGGFSVWQTLPLGVTDAYGSPYCLALGLCRRSAVHRRRGARRRRRAAARLEASRRPRRPLRVVRGARDGASNARVRGVRARAPPLARCPTACSSCSERALRPVAVVAMAGAVPRPRRRGAARVLAPRVASSFAHSCSSSTCSSCSGRR